MAEGRRSGRTHQARREHEPARLADSQSARPCTEKRPKLVQIHPARGADHLEDCLITPADGPAWSTQAPTYAGEAEIPRAVGMLLRDELVLPVVSVLPNEMKGPP
jgi:hypothetical protein